MFSAAPVSEKTVTFGATVLRVVHGPREVELRSILNPPSLKEPSVQLRSTRLEENALAASPEGAAGTVWGVVASAVFE